MLTFIKNLLEKWTCLHKWTLYQEVETYNDRISKQRPVRITHTLICTECGKIKKIIV